MASAGWPFQLPQAPLSHYWSLAIEEQFYLVWPLMLLPIADKRRGVQLWLAIIVGALLLRIGLTLQGRSPSTSSPKFVLGRQCMFVWPETAQLALCLTIIVT